MTLVKGDLKAPFSITTTPQCKGGRYSIPWIAPLYPWSIPYNARWHQVPFFESLVCPDLGLKPGLMDHWWTIYSLGQWSIGLSVRVFANSPGDQGSISGRIIPKTPKMVFHASLLNTQHYKLRIKGKVEQSRKWSSALPLHCGVVVIEKGAFGSPSTMVANFTVKNPPTERINQLNNGERLVFVLTLIIILSHER